MKSLLSFALVAGLLFTACEQPTDVTHQIQQEGLPSGLDVPVSMTRAEVTGLLPDLEAGVTISQGTESLPVQYDDFDGDGTWDEVFFLATSSEGSVEFSLKPASSVNQPDMAPRTNLHLGKVIVRDSLTEEITSGNRIMGTETETTISQYQYEGPGWENDRIAFRTYFDERNGIDIFGKTTEEMVLEQVGVGDNYHELRDWGMDILKVGTSLGAGALALQYEDSLYRVTDDSTSTVRYVVEGPLRSILEYHLPTVNVAGKTVDVIHRITIVAGIDGYKSEVSVSPALPGLSLATGIVNLQSDTSFTMTDNGLAVLYTHAPQAYLGEYLGLAVVARESMVLDYFTTPEEGDGITQTFGLTMPLSDTSPTTFWFMAAWETRMPDMTEKAAFEDLIKAELPLLGL